MAGDAPAISVLRQVQVAYQRNSFMELSISDAAVVSQILEAPPIGSQITVELKTDAARLSAHGTGAHGTDALASASCTVFNLNLSHRLFDFVQAAYSHWTRGVVPCDGAPSCAPQMNIQLP